MSESVFWLLRDARHAYKQGLAAIQQRQRTRLAEAVAFARARSTYYRQLYDGLPDREDNPTRLPVTDKKRLMARFDDWVTDQDIKIGDVRAFVADPALIGEAFLGKYTVATTSGTTGTPGIFLIDERTLAVASALMFRAVSAWLSLGDALRIFRGGMRTSMICATGGHFAEIVAATRLRKGSDRRAKAIQVLPADMPLPEMVRELNRFRPVVLAPYASTGALLATEQHARRLTIEPVLVVLSAEGLPASEYDRISKAFRVRTRDSYAATECPFISYRCEHGWLHVNSDWVVLEGVNANYEPVPPGEQSHTVLVSNLANRVQPILRYDLGDSILQRPDPCPCGNPLPAIQVRGRTADVLTFPTEAGQQVSIPSLVFEVDEVPGIALAQIAQTTPTTLRVRLRPSGNADADQVWQAVHRVITQLLTKHGLPHVAVERAGEEPQPSPGGKYRTVIPLARTTA